MLENFAEKVLGFMTNPSPEKKEEIKKLYEEIQNNSDIEEKKLDSAKEVFNYVEWVLSESI